jgi:hypothetical protein
MHYYFDTHGWYSSEAIADRCTDVAPAEVPAERAEGQPWPNWTGEAWVMAEYAAPAPLPAPSTAPRRITVGAFFDRFGQYKWEILADQDAQVHAVVLDATVREFIDLDNPQLPDGLAVLIHAGHSIDPDAVLNDPVQPHEMPG